MTFQEQIDLLATCNKNTDIFDGKVDIVAAMQTAGVVAYVKYHVYQSEQSSYSSWDYLRNHRTSIYAVY